MKPITLHPLSVLVGLALAGFTVLLTGAAQSPAVTHHPRTEVVGQIPAEWWTYVFLSTSFDGTLVNTYTVPPDMHFVVTMMQTNGGVLANGTSIGDMLEPVNYNVSLHDRNGTRAVVPSGSFLTTGVSGSARLWGYLEPVR